MQKTLLIHPQGFVGDAIATVGEFKHQAHNLVSIALSIVIAQGCLQKNQLILVSITSQLDAVSFYFLRELAHDADKVIALLMKKIQIGCWSVFRSVHMVWSKTMQLLSN